MALLQTDHDNAAWLTDSPLLPARLAARRFAHIREYLFAPIRHSLETLRQWSIRRRVRVWRTMTERARQRRALAQLSDRELRDIGITRYEIEFVLRQSPWR
jgi:uncharacterized protein YjiS (DUF1127 family)